MNTSTRSYTFTIIPSNEEASDWLVEADAEDLKGSLERARRLAQDLDSRIELRDAAGFTRGRVEPSGDYTLN